MTELEVGGVYRMLSRDGINEIWVFLTDFMIDPDHIHIAKTIHVNEGNEPLCLILGVRSYLGMPAAMAIIDGELGELRYLPSPPNFGEWFEEIR